MQPEPIVFNSTRFRPLASSSMSVTVLRKTMGWSDVRHDSSSWVPSRDAAAVAGSQLMRYIYQTEY